MLLEEHPQRASLLLRAIEIHLQTSQVLLALPLAIQSIFGTAPEVVHLVAQALHVSFIAESPGSGLLGLCQLDFQDALLLLELASVVRLAIEEALQSAMQSITLGLNVVDLVDQRFTTATLSNGNVSLLQDLQRHGSLPFTHLFSAENFGAHKPSPQVYHGAANQLGLDPAQCTMVAAHLKDLKAAKSCGLRTIYVERELEEAWSADEVAKAKKDGFVDIWIDINTGGIIEVAKRLGIE